MELEPMSWQILFLGLGTIFAIWISWYYYRKSKTDAFQRELVGPAKRMLEEIKSKVNGYEFVDKEKLEALVSRARDWDSYIIEAALSELFSPANLWNEYLSGAEKIIDGMLAKFGLDSQQLNDALEEEIDRIHGEIHTVRRFLYSVDLYMTGSSGFLVGQWLKSICVIFKRAGTFVSLGAPAGSGVGGLMIEIDGQWTVIAPHVKDRAKQFFESVQQEIKSSALEELGKRLLKACEMSQAKIEKV